MYTQEHLAYAAEVVARVLAVAESIPGLRMVYEPKHRRFLHARFEPLAHFRLEGARADDRLPATARP